MSFDLERFTKAQDPVLACVLDELKAGAKRTHWMWFIFPQIAGLGRSATAQNYAIASLEEARRYLRHPLLGPRLNACVNAVLKIEGPTAREIFGSPDNLKFRSSMTLFAQASPEDPVFGTALDRFFGGGKDELTLHILKK